MACSKAPSLAPETWPRPAPSGGVSAPARALVLTVAPGPDRAVSCRGQPGGAVPRDLSGGGRPPPSLAPDERRLVSRGSAWPGGRRRDALCNRPRGGEGGRARRRIHRRHHGGGPDLAVSAGAAEALWRSATGQLRPIVPWLLRRAPTGPSHLGRGGTDLTATLLGRVPRSPRGLWKGYRHPSRGPDYVRMAAHPSAHYREGGGRTSGAKGCIRALSSA